MPIFDRLVDRLSSSKPSHSPWSLAQLGDSEIAHKDLHEWASNLSPFEFDDLSRQRPVYLGIILLWMHAEVLRRHGGDRKVWLVLSDRSIVPWREATWGRLYNGGGHLHQSHGNLLERAVQSFVLRHAFDEDDVKKWFQLIYLQFGFTHEDAKRRLSVWLSGQTPPVSVEKLLSASDDGAREFQRMWSKLRQFRLGNVSRRNMEAHLRSCCWVLPEWTDDLLKAASEAHVAWGDVEETEDEAFFTAPRLVWDAQIPPSFQVEICGLEGLPGDTDLELRCGGTILRKLLRQSDGGLALDGDPMVILGSGTGLKPQMELRLVTGDGTLVRHGVVTLWNGDADVSLLRPSDGLLVAEDQLNSGQSFLAITFQDLILIPSSHEQAPLGSGYVLHRYQANWNGVIQAKLDDMAVWSSAAFGTRPAPLPMDVLEVRWEETLDFTQAVNPSPWWTRIRIRVRDSEWTFVGMRWLRADGQLIKFKRPPEQLSLVEADAARPIQVRVVLKHQSGRLATVPVTLPPPIKGCLKWPENGRPQVQHGGKTMLAADAQRALWSFFLPTVEDAAGIPIEVEPNACSFMEGDAVRGRSRSRAGILPAVAGYGAPAFISRDPYNSDERLLAVASRVIDGGVIGQVRIEDKKVMVPRHGDFDLGQDHRLMVWFSTKDKPGTLEKPHISATDSGWEFLLPEGHWLLGLALFYQGSRLGSWFDWQKWSGVMLKPGATPIAEMAALLRVWKAPLLQEQDDACHRAAVVNWLRREWQEVLPVWLATCGHLQGPEGETWPCPALADHWKEAVQSLLIEASPRPESESCWAFVEKMAKGSACARAIDQLGFTVMGVADVCPLLGARLLETALKAPVTGVTKTNCVWLLDQLRGAYIVTDKTADELASKHGGRDGVWLRSCIPSFHELSHSHRTLPLAYRRLAMKSEFRKFAFGVWQQEIRSRLHL
jgi:hypothetical protein